MTPSTRRVLLVAYHFPPMGGSGVQRPLGFARYLAQCGWQPIVLCAAHRRYPLMDASLCSAIPADVHVERVAGLEPGALAPRLAPVLKGFTGRAASSDVEDRLYWRLGRLTEWLGVPEPEMLWVNAARRAAIRLARERDIHAVVTSGPPFSVHLVGDWLKRRLGLSWVADFRDPLTRNFTYSPRSRRQDRFWRRLERDVVNGADFVVATCPENASDLSDRYPQRAGRFATVTNGFDPADFGTSERDVASPESEGRLTLTHVGAFYRQQSVQPILGAMQAIIEKRPEWRGCLQLEVIGSLSRQEWERLQPDQRRLLVFRGFAPHAEAVAAMRSAAALYLTAPDCEGGRLCIPGKTFEYLASNRPIFASVPAGTWLAGVLAKSTGVRVVHEREPGDLAHHLESFLNEWVIGPQWPIDRHAEIQGFRRDHLAGALADVLNEWTSRAQRGAFHCRDRALPRPIRTGAAAGA